MPTDGLPEFMLDAEPTEPTPLLSAFRQFVEAVGGARVKADAFEVPLAVFSDSRVRATRVAVDVDNPAHMWLSAQMHIDGHSFTIYSVDLPIPASPDEPYDEPRSEPSDRELAGRHTHDAIDEEDLL